jgi:hypothetical protein
MFNLSIRIPSNVEVDTPSETGIHYEARGVDSYLWRGVVYDFWSSNKVFQDIAYELELLRHELDLCHARGLRLLTEKEFLERKQQAMDGIVILMNRGFFDEEGNAGKLKIMIGEIDTILKKVKMIYKKDL